MCGVQYVHSKNVAHLDLKPENLLISGDSKLPLIKLCDFGHSSFIAENQFRRRTVGTPAYSAPEIHHKKSNFTFITLIFSFFLILKIYWGSSFC